MLQGRSGQRVARGLIRGYNWEAMDRAWDEGQPLGRGCAQGQADAQKAALWNTLTPQRPRAFFSQGFSGHLRYRTVCKAPKGAWQATAAASPLGVGAEGRGRPRA